jgi:sigma-B regulation protein RsbU (phosphoserine phosphatase)
LQPFFDALDRVLGAPQRVWKEDAGELRVLRGTVPAWRVTLPIGNGPVVTPEGPRLFLPLDGEQHLWLERTDDAGQALAEGVTALVEHATRADRETTRLSEELATRYEEIDLLYSITEVLGRTTRLDEAAASIVRQVSDVVGAGRASIVVHDVRSGMLQTVAARGFDPRAVPDLAIGDPDSIAARVFRENRASIGVASDGPAERGYLSGAYMSLPICSHAPGAASRCVGVINLTDRMAGGKFSASDAKLVSAAANQIGVAIELARLLEREREQHRLHAELELAQHLQLSLLPDPSVLHGDATVAARCLSAEQVGGDFYMFSRLGLGLVGVMLGDVSSHGFAAALGMAAVMAAAGIHTSSADPPDLTLAALRDSLSGKLASSDTYLTVFYGILDPVHGRLTYSNAGHPYAFRSSAAGAAERLEATAPPLGLAGNEALSSRAVAWSRKEDLLCLWTDGLVDACNTAGERYGEARLLSALLTRRHLEPEQIVTEVLAEADRFGPKPTDDRTLLVLRL